MLFREWRRKGTLLATVAVLAGSLFASGIPLPETASAASVTNSINWGSATGKTANGFTYGMNIYKGHENSYATNTNYQNAVKYLKPGLIRIHRAQQMNDSATDNAGWVKNASSSSYAWDYAKIDTVVGNMVATANSLGATVMINISNWPAYLKASGSNKLRTDKYDEYGNFIASLVQYVNKTKGWNVKYWEVLNEVDGGRTDGTDRYNGNMAEAAKIYNIVAQKIKAVDSTVKVGGPAFENAWSSNQTNVDAFISNAHPYMDFISYHTYYSCSGSSDSSIWDNAQQAGSHTSFMKGRLAAYTSRAIETFHNEYNISYCPPDTRMNNEKGMVFDALMMMAMAKAGPTGTAAWNEVDGWYGKIDANSTFTRRPSAHLYNVFNTDMTGTIVSTTTSNNKAVDIMATKGGTWKKFALVNRSGVDQTVQISFSGWTTTPAAGTTFVAKKISSSGLSYSSPTYGTLTSSTGYTISANSAVVFTINGY